MAWRISVITEMGDEKLEMSMEELKALILACVGSDDKAKRAIEAGFSRADRHLREATVTLR